MGRYIYYRWTDRHKTCKDAVSRLTAELETIKRRMNQAYLDKLDGTITEEFWAEHAGS